MQSKSDLRKQFFTLLALLIPLAACNTVEVMIEYPPTPDPQATATFEALATENARLATHVAAMQATIGITPSPTATAPPTRTPAPPAPSTSYYLIPLDTAANAPLDFVSPPVGSTTLGEIPFELSERAFKSQSASPPNDDYPTTALLVTDVPRASRLHLLLNSGNGFTQFEGKTIGQAIVFCDNTVTSVFDLRLGQNIREWHLAHNVVYTAPDVQQVWTGALSEFPNLTGHIDLVSLDLPSACRSGRLTAIEIADISTETTGSLDPALNLAGVTVEYSR